MPWRRKSITPNFLPFKDGLTHDPGLVVEIEPIDALCDSPIWRDALMTKVARLHVPPFVREAWHVRRLGTTDPFAIVVQLVKHPLNRRVLSRRPEQAMIARTKRLLVVLPELLLTVHGAEVRRAYSLLADLMLGTRQRPRLRVRPSTAPAVDIAAIALLPRR